MSELSSQHSVRCKVWTRVVPLLAVRVRFIGPLWLIAMCCGFRCGVVMSPTRGSSRVNMRVRDRRPISERFGLKMKAIELSILPAPKQRSPTYLSTSMCAFSTFGRILFLRCFEVHGIAPRAALLPPSLGSKPWFGRSRVPRCLFLSHSHSLPLRWHVVRERPSTRRSLHDRYLDGDDVYS